MRGEDYVRRARVVRVVDGDTVDLEVDLGWQVKIVERVRVYGIDTPEVRGSESAAGLFVKAVVERLLPVGSLVVIWSRDFAADRYGRTIGSIALPDGRDLAMGLLSTFLAWPTDEHGRVVGERDLSRLTGIRLTE